MRLLDLVQAKAALQIGRSSLDKPEAEHGEGYEKGRQRQEVLKPRARMISHPRRCPDPEPGTELDPEMT